MTGLLPQQKHAAKSQRTRWEHGHLETLLKQVPHLLNASVRQKRFDLLALALELCVPPLSLLVMMWAAATAGSLLAEGLGASWSPLYIVWKIPLYLAFLVQRQTKWIRTERDIVDAQQS